MFPAVAFRPVRLLIVSVVLTAGATVLAGLAGRLMFGVFFGIGMLLGLLNALLVRRSVDSITAEEHPLKKAMALNSASRLAVITVAALVLAAVFRPNGLGVMFGLALFQVMLVFSTSLPVLKKLREEQRTASSGGGADGSEGRTTSDD